MAEDTITRDELAAYYRRHDSSSLAAEAAAGMAARIFADVEAHREPEYEPGAVYRDAAGMFWLYQPFRAGDPPGSHLECPWLKPGSAGPFSAGAPKRPLRKLVLETAALDHGQVLEEITAWTNLGRSEAVDLAWRVCKLAGGECA